MQQRPTAVLLNDAFAGHRKWWAPEWVPTPELASVWTEWDYVLLRVSQYIEDYTSANGYPVWIEEDPDVWFDVSKFESSYERDTHEFRENHEIKPSESLRAIPRWEDDVEAPSMEKWLRRLEEDDQGGFESRPEGGTPRPPTAAELAALRNPERNA